MGWLIIIVSVIVLAIGAALFDRAPPALAACRIESATKPTLGNGAYSNVDVFMDCMKARGFELDPRQIGKSTDPDPIWNDPNVWARWWVVGSGAKNKSDKKQ